MTAPIVQPVPAGLSRAFPARPRQRGPRARRSRRHVRHPSVVPASRPSQRSRSARPGSRHRPRLDRPLASRGRATARADTTVSSCRWRRASPGSIQAAASALSTWSHSTATEVGAVGAACVEPDRYGFIAATSSANWARTEAGRRQGELSAHFGKVARPALRSLTVLTATLARITKGGQASDRNSSR